MDWTIMPIRGIDVEEWSALISAAAAVDGTEETYSTEELEHELTILDQDRDAWRVTDGKRLLAAGAVMPRPGTHDGRGVFVLDAVVDPTARGCGIGRRLLDEQERRAVELAAEKWPGVPLRLRTDAPEHALAARRLLERRGYRPVRWFVELNLDLTRWTPPALMSATDTVIAPYTGDLDDAVRAARNASFADHWGSAPADADEWRRHYTGTPGFRPEPSRVVRDADGSVVAFALLYEYADREAYVGQLGVVPGSQRKGLGRATLIAALEAARDQGYRTSALGVDGENAHDAGALYESIGYRTSWRAAAYIKDL